MGFWLAFYYPVVAVDNNRTVNLAQICHTYTMRIPIRRLITITEYTILNHCREHFKMPPLTVNGTKKSKKAEGVKEEKKTTKQTQ